MTFKKMLKESNDEKSAFLLGMIYAWPFISNDNTTILAYSSYKTGQQSIKMILSKYSDYFTKSTDEQKVLRESFMLDYFKKHKEKLTTYLDGYNFNILINSLEVNKKLYSDNNKNINPGVSVEIKLDFDIPNTINKYEFIYGQIEKWLINLPLNIKDKFISGVMDGRSSDDGGSLIALDIEPQKAHPSIIRRKLLKLNDVLGSIFNYNPRLLQELSSGKNDQFRFSKKYYMYKYGMFVPFKIDYYIKKYNLNTTDYIISDNFLLDTRYQNVKCSFKQSDNLEINNLAINIHNDTISQLDKSLLINKYRSKFFDDNDSDDEVLNASINVKNYAKAKANYLCEYNNSHETFISKGNYARYVEGHHLIPFSKRKQFDLNIDIEENIIALCPNCHRKIHHAIDQEKYLLINKLYALRFTSLVNKGINVSISILYEYYNLNINFFNIYDSVKKQKLPFVSQVENKAKIYVCGPTVYDDAHLGHARSAIVFDLLHRVLKANGYEVTMVKNFTDVDDKIINKMSESGKTLEEITTFYIDSYSADMKALNILPNTIEPKATENLEVMKELVQKLLDEDKAYKLNDGIYFDTTKDENYGKISNRASDENSIARVEGNINKKDDKDFVLWKFNTNEVSFDADFGDGRPGWHCECSAMIDKHLANHDLPYAVDIHGGGADLLFPHHENEASQTRMAYGQEIAKYWIHNGFVNIDGEKMSKSLGNSFFLKDSLKQYNGEVIRFYMMTTHYRADFGFSEDDLISSKKRLDKLYRLKKRLYGGGKSSVNKKFKTDILDALNDDMNTSKALATIDEFIAVTNETLDKEPKNKGLKKEVLANIAFLNDILGIGYQDGFSYFQFGISEDEKQSIEELISKRDKAKKEKNFELSDKIRDELTTMQISLMDTANGTMWEKL